MALTRKAEGALTPDCAFSVVVELVFDEAKDQTGWNQHLAPLKAIGNQHTWTCPLQIRLSRTSVYSSSSSIGLCAPRRTSLNWYCLDMGGGG